MSMIENGYIPERNPLVPRGILNGHGSSLTYTIFPFINRQNCSFSSQFNAYNFIDMPEKQLIGRKPSQFSKEWQSR